MVITIRPGERTSSSHCRGKRHTPLRDDSGNDFLQDGVGELSRHPQTDRVEIEGILQHRALVASRCDDQISQIARSWDTRLDGHAGADEGHNALSLPPQEGGEVRRQRRVGRHS